jgi:hypothetical protein
MCKSSKPKMPPPPAPPAPQVKQETADKVEQPSENTGENIKAKRRREGRNALRIDVNVSGVGAQGLNIPL